jgi:serine/threonine protein kinase
LNDKPTKKELMAPAIPPTPVVAQGTLPSATPGVPVAEGTMLADKYRVERVLGRGGMGVVVAATHVELDQRVALKFLLPEAMESVEVVERFAREARAAVKIESEHVARVIDVGKLDNGLPYMVMEYLNGRDLAAELDEHGRLTVENTLDYVLQACEAIAQAHALGIIHRDLKPANLFVTTRADGTTSIKVLDFGISKVSLAGASPAEMSLTQTAAIMGSPTYMSPEQMRASRDVDPRADIWALGVILYELLTGQPPFVGNTMPELCASILKDSPDPLRSVRADIPEPLEAAIMRCLEKKPDARFANVAELTAALVDFAPRRSRLSAERTARILRTTGIKTASVPPLASEAPAPVTMRFDAPAPTVATATAGAWSQVSEPKAEPAKAEPPKSNVKWFAFAFALASAAGALVWLSRGDAPAQTTVLAPVATGTLSAAELAPKNDPAGKELGAKTELKAALGAAALPATSIDPPEAPAPKNETAAPSASLGKSEPAAAAVVARARTKAASPAAPPKAPEPQPTPPPAPTRKNPLSIEIK